MARNLKLVLYLYVLMSGLKFNFDGYDDFDEDGGDDGGGVDAMVMVLMRVAMVVVMTITMMIVVTMNLMVLIF